MIQLTVIHSMKCFLFITKEHYLQSRDHSPHDLLHDRLELHWLTLGLSESRWRSNPRWLLLSHWLLSFGAKFESSSVIGSQFWRQNNFQTRTRIGPWKMAKKKGGKMIFKPGPPLALGKLVFHSFSARENNHFTTKMSVSLTIRI